uniref:Uncharacterized protein n=1 Tax=Zea mays TaxID=4577 RepID=A0A804PAI2_MAIZE
PHHAYPLLHKFLACLPHHHHSTRPNPTPTDLYISLPPTQVHRDTNTERQRAGGGTISLPSSSPTSPLLCGLLSSPVYFVQETSLDKDGSAELLQVILLRVRRQCGGRRPGRRRGRGFRGVRRQGGRRSRAAGAVVGAGGGDDGQVHLGRRRRGRVQHRVPRAPLRRRAGRRQGPPQQRAPPPRVPPGARRAPTRPPPAHRPPPCLLRPARGRRAGAGVRGEREPARAAPRRGQGGGDDAVGAAGVGGAAGGAGARVPARPLRAAGGARRREGLQRAPGRGHVRQAVRLRVGADGVLGRRAPAAVRAHRHARLPGVRRPALHPLGRRHQEERRVQLRRPAPGAPHGDGGLLRGGGRPPPHRRRRAAAQGRRPAPRDGRREARHRLRRRRGRRRGGAGRGLCRREPQPPAVHGRRGAHPGAERAGIHLRRGDGIGRSLEGVSHQWKVVASADALRSGSPSR